MPTALIIDDRAESLLELGEAASEAGFRVLTARSPEAAKAVLAKDLPDVAILNLQVGSDPGQEEAFELFARTELSDVVEVFLISDNPSIDSARRGMQVGASDYLVRPLDLPRLTGQLAQLARELDRSTAGEEGDVHATGRGLLVGESAPMRRLYRMLRKVAPTRATVLLTGESGSGKELVARTLHELSPRSGSPFVAMNCGAVPSELVESELFGHRKGAFTGAHKSHNGFFSRADGGTLLLDEITEMDPDLQVKLLRVLETHRFRPVGAEREREVDVRIVAATNREPDEAVRDGTLREDLYYRLAEFPIRVPPLRERGDDVILLAQTFLDQCNRREGRDTRFAPEALDLMRLHDWPGNVRELKNAVSRAFILAESEIRPDDLPGNIPSGSADNGDSLRFPLGYNLKEMERRMILATLEYFEGNKRATAESLGISLKTLYNRLKQYGRHGSSSV